jgi:hypothetical protein
MWVFVIISQLTRKPEPLIMEILVLRLDVLAANKYIGLAVQVVTAGGVFFLGCVQGSYVNIHQVAGAYSASRQSHLNECRGLRLNRTGLKVVK